MDTGAPAPAHAPLEAPAAAPVASPEVRVGLVTGAASVTIGSGSGLGIYTVGGAPLAMLRAGDTCTARRSGPDLVLSTGAGVGAGPARLVQARTDDPAALVRVNGRDYRGWLELSPAAGGGVTVVNVVPLELYLQGVVGAEMGVRPDADREALAAQAIVSRTYAMRNRGRRAAQGYDYQSGVGDQVYAGVGMENPAATRAVRETAGLIVTFEGQPIDAFFFSTCGGRTERGTEVFRQADRPYLQSVSDLAPDGTAYCSISPRFQWREEFSGEALRQALRQYLPATMGVPAARVTRVRDVRVEGRTVSGRVRALSIELPDGFVSIPGPQVRQVLRQPLADILRSTLFTVSETRSGGQVTRLIVNGSGAGHGVGFCQWGAVGRARAGQTREQIVAAYFPGTGIERAY